MGEEDHSHYENLHKVKHVRNRGKDITRAGAPARKETKKARGPSEEVDIKAETWRNYHAKEGKGVAHGGNSMCKDPEKEGKSGDRKITKPTNSGVRVWLSF